MKRIVITGGSLNGNSGAEAMLVTAIKRIQEKNPDAEFGIFTPYFNDDKILWDSEKYGDKISLIDASPIKLALIIFPFSIFAGLFKLLKLNFMKSIMPKQVKYLWDANLFLDVAGVSFIDSRVKFIPFNILSIYPAFLLKVPVIKCAQATGPYKKIINRISAKHCLKKCNKTFARGNQTLKHLQELKIPVTKYELSTDIAFCNKIGDSITSENHNLDDFFVKLKSDNTNNKQFVGFCPSSVVEQISDKEGIDYLGFLEEFSEKLINKGYYLVIFPNATKEHKPELRRNNDIPLIQDLTSRLSKKHLEKTFSAYTTNLNTDGVKTLINNLDFSIVSRFHAMIFALSLEKPVFVLGWSHKYLEVMAQFGLEKYVVDYQVTKIEKLVEDIEDISKNKDEITQQISQNIEKVKEIAFKQINLMNEILS